MNAYEGSGVFDVVMISRIDYEFYAVDEKLAPDLRTINLKNDKRYLLLLIHYFGFTPYNFEDVLTFCAENSIRIIEDCAHTLDGRFKNNLLGTFGTYAFHSIHKVLPTTDGGILINNSADQNFQIEAKEEGIKIETIEQFVNSDLNRISNVRIKNFNHWTQILHGIEGVTPMYDYLLNGNVPLNFPILVSNNKRESLYFYLMEHEAPTSALYYQMIPQISQVEFPMSYEISKNILNLPLHQDTTFSEIERISDLIKQFFNS